MKHWKIIDKQSKKDNRSLKEIINTILTNRNINSKKEIENFLNPDINNVYLKSSEINQKEFDKFKDRIDKALLSNEKIVIFGDYDVDGICATAILWETLYVKTKKVVPYIPNRSDEGYGLSKKGIENVLKSNPDTKIIITVDNGIVAYDAVLFAKENGIDVIITDHHVKGATIPDAFCILHTTLLCGAGIAWVIAKELGFEKKDKVLEKLELATLATIADLVPLINNNRAIVREGLEVLKNTNRIGISELLKEAGIEKSLLGVYAIGHMIAPRLNATGRIQSAMNALRLLCTHDEKRAKELSLMLGNVNRDRQGLTEESVEHAKLLAIETTYSSRITIVSDRSYNQGIIGLIASRMVESYYKPTFAIAIGEKISKGSARSIYGVNIIELLRSVSGTLIEAGGHPMAAGFSVETQRIEEFAKALAKKAEEVITDETLKRYINIDMLLPFDAISQELVSEINKLEPFGMGNPEPVFATENVEVLEVRKMGREQNHLKLKVLKDKQVFDGVGFSMAEKADLAPGDQINIAYTINKNIWKNKTSIQLKLRDIKVKN